MEQLKEFVIVARNDPRFKGIDLFWDGTTGWNAFYKNAQRFPSRHQAESVMFWLNFEHGHLPPEVVGTENRCLSCGR